MGDTVLAQNPDLPFLDSLPHRQDAVAAALLAHIRGEGELGVERATARDDGDFDTDKAEKALRLIIRLLSVRPMLFGPDFKAALAQAGRLAAEGCGRAMG